jgi:mannose-1-phosphate guanylyltransferase
MLRRVTGAPLFGAPIVIANAEHRFLIAEQLREIGCLDTTLLHEPIGRNTCPAAAVAANLTLRQDPEGLILLMPVDHMVGNVPEFQIAIETGRMAAAQGRFVLYGITPTVAATGYGYIQCGDTLENPRIRQVLGFKEKPDAATATGYVESGSYAWNSGMFLLPARNFLEELRRLEPQLLQACTQAVDKATKDLGFCALSLRRSRTRRMFRSTMP